MLEYGAALACGASLPMTSKIVSFVAALALTVLACDESAPGVPGRAAAPSAEEPLPKPRFVRGPTGGKPIAPFVARELEKATAAGGRVVVYVGADWCEPCQHFHRAIEAGELDAAFAGLVLFEFDLDADESALVEAGYRSRLIPLFAIPGPDGRGTDARFFGSIKGPGAVADIVPRLRKLLDEQALE